MKNMTCEELKTRGLLLMEEQILVFYPLFWEQIPGRLIFAIEPEESNYEMLKKNTSHYPNIKTIKAAIWIRKLF